MRKPFALNADGLFIGQHRQKIARQRIDRLLAPIVFYRQMRKRVELEIRFSFLWRLDTALEKPDHEQDDDDVSNG